MVSKFFIIADATEDQILTFSLTDTKRYVPVVILLIQDNAKLLQELKSGFKRAINWSKCQSKDTDTQPRFRLLN